MMNPQSETPERILDAVMELIQDSGLQAVTLSAVCRKAKISKGGLVHYYPSKESMIDAFISRAGTRYLEMIEAAFASLKPGNGKRALALIDLLLDVPLDQGDEDDDCSAVMLALIQSEQRQPIVKDLFETVKGWLVEDGLSADLAVLVLVTVDGFWFKSVIEESNELAIRGRQLRRQLRKLVLDECPRRGPKQQTQRGRSAYR